VRELVASHADELAAIIVEPVVQGAGGMRFHSPACVALLRECCDEHGLLLVLDEIATGFGRTGELFACEHAAVAPDVMCVGKALTGGYMTLAATLCTREVADAVSAGEGGGLMHGPTFMANPLACSVALASLDLLLQGADGAQDGGWRPRVRAIERGLREGLEPARALAGVADVRVLGAIGVVQLEREVDIAAATDAAVRRGVWLRPFRDLIYTMPPYVIEADDLAQVTAAVVDAARAASGGRRGPAAQPEGLDHQRRDPLRRDQDACATRGRSPSQRRHGSFAPMRASSAICGPLARSSVSTSTKPKRAIASRFERSRREGSCGHGVITTARTLRPAARADCRVSSVWLIVPRPGRAAISSGSRNETARSQTVRLSASGDSRPPTPSTISV
jgi:hypothetical protein